ncbi:MAG: hypothetical protein V4635_14235 [Bacteroidota bacterium]
MSIRETQGPQGNPNNPTNFWTSANAVPLIVSLIFALVFIGYILILLIRPELSKDMGTNIWPLLSLLIGFFTGRTTSEKKR